MTDTERTSDEEYILENQPKFTHRATITITSNGPAEEVNILVKFDPDAEGRDVEQLGYLPACFQIVQGYMLPAIEQAYMEWAGDPLLRMESPSKFQN